MDVSIYEVVAVVVSFLIGLVVSRAYYKKFKEILHQVRDCIDAIDTAFEDDSLTKEEVRDIYEKCIKPIKEVK